MSLSSIVMMGLPAMMLMGGIYMAYRGHANHALSKDRSARHEGPLSSPSALSHPLFPGPLVYYKIDVEGLSGNVWSRICTMERRSPCSVGDLQVPDGAEFRVGASDSVEGLGQERMGGSAFLRAGSFNLSESLPKDVVDAILADPSGSIVRRHLHQKLRITSRKMAEGERAYMIVSPSSGLAIVAPVSEGDPLSHLRERALISLGVGIGLCLLSLSIMVLMLV